MKKLTPNQQQYLKEIRRIRTNLSKLRKQGYDISELAEKYTTTLPNRVTQKTLRDLHELTARKIRLEAKSKYVGITPTYTTKEGKRIVTPLTTKPQLYAQPQELQVNVPKPTLKQIPLTPQQELDAFSPFMEIPSEEPEPPKNRLPKSVLLSQRELRELHQNIEAIKMSDGTYMYVDKHTGEIVKFLDEEEPTPETEEAPPQAPTEPYEPPYEEYAEEPSDYTSLNDEIPDLSYMMIDYLNDIASQFSYEISTKLHKAIQDMIDEKGLQSVADAFTETMNNHPNMLERLSNVREKYHAMKELMGEIAERLDIDLNVKDLMRHEISSMSMSDIEDYM